MKGNIRAVACYPVSIVNAVSRKKALRFDFNRRLLVSFTCLSFKETAAAKKKTVKLISEHKMRKIWLILAKLISDLDA
jgi:hypothetical protein